MVIDDGGIDGVNCASDCGRCRFYLAQTLDLLIHDEGYPIARWTFQPVWRVHAFALRD